jgi:hypothetical protein
VHLVGFIIRIVCYLHVKCVRRIILDTSAGSALSVAKYGDVYFFLPSTNSWLDNCLSTGTF